MVRFRANSRDFVTAPLIDAVLPGAAGTTNGPPDLDNPGVYKAPTQPRPLPVLRDLLLLNVMYVIVSRSEDAVSAFC